MDTMNGQCLDHVVVVEHEREGFSPPVHEVVGEQSQHGLKVRRLWETKQSERGSAKVWVKRLQSSNEIGKETGGIVVLYIGTGGRP